VLDAIAMGLFDPTGPIATATLQGLDEHLRVDAGPGWSRNDDRWDHANVEDLSPWGSDYDSAEWVITDLRGAIALRMAGQPERADALLAWVLEQSQKNYGMVAETYDELTGAYKFNAPMLGFGAGAHALALAHRADATPDPACGAYYPEAPMPPGDSEGSETSTGDTITTGDASTGDATTEMAPTTGVTPTGSGGETAIDAGTGGPSTGTTSEDTDTGPSGAGDAGCACREDPRQQGTAALLLLVSALLVRRRRAR
jgi:hypothetical protein